MRSKTAPAVILILLATPAAARDCYNQQYDVQRLVNRGESVWVNVSRGPVEKIHVQWHDNIGVNHNAEGEVFLDGALIGRDDIKAEGNRSDFLVRRFSDTGEVRLHILRDNAFVDWVNVKYCNDQTKGESPLERLSRNMAAETDALYRAVSEEARSRAQLRAAHDLDDLRSSAQAFYVAQADKTGRRQQRADFRRLEKDFEQTRQSMRITHFSYSVDRQWHSVRGLFRDIEDRYGY
jgi:hypothetical protein